MRSLFTSFVMGLALVSHAQTQQWGQVYFDNRVFWPPRLIWDHGSGTPLVGTNFIAELFYGTNMSSMVRLSNAAPARFRPEGTRYPGTWSGGLRMLVGIPPGTPTFMQVWLWNNDAAGSFDEALQQGTNAPYLLVSSIFTYTPPPLNSLVEAHYMSNFAAFQGDCGMAFSLRPSIVVQPSNQTVRVGDDVIMSVVTSNAACYHQWQFNGTNINALPGSRFLLLTNVQPSQAGHYRVILNAGPFGGGVTSQVAQLTVEAPPQWAQVLFDNSVLNTNSVNDPLIRVAGAPVTGTHLLAQLFYGTNDFNLIAVTNRPATFREPTTSFPGTWIGGFRTLVGLLPGTLTRLQVRIWDGDSFPTYEEAEAAGHVLVRTLILLYQPPPPGSPPYAYAMVNFSGVNVPCDNFFPGPPAILQHPTNQLAFIGQDVVFSAVATNACLSQWQFNGTNPPGFVPGLSGRKLKISNVQPHHEGEYRLIVTQSARTEVRVGATSQVARLTVRPPPQFMSARYDNGAFAFQVSEETGRAVVIETAPDLNPGTTWTPVFTNTAPFSFTNSTPADRQRFYRTVIR
jgi:hypothetical protein